MALTALGIVAALGAAGSTAYAASQQGGGGGGGSGQQRRVGVPFATGGQSYLSRLFALNAGTQGPSFQDYVKSGGTATFPLAGAGQFSPQEAERLGLVGAGNQPVPFFDPTEQNRLTEAQALFLGQQRLGNRQRGVRKGPLSPDEQLADISGRVARQEAALRGGSISGKRAERLTRKLDRNRSEIEQLRAQLFGAPGAPGPWDLRGGANPDDVFGGTSMSGASGGGSNLNIEDLPPAIRKHLRVVSLGQL